ncbi:MAG: metallophosphoesterase family protein [Archaeoglobaceae archaeon]|nr:metallophosphoesterase family protein [Archaeoglobaceae archaeon]
MRILILSDIHSCLEKMEKIIKKEKFDILLIAGDLTNFKNEDVLAIDRILSFEGIECYAVHGNCDYESILEYDFDSINFIHRKSVKIDEFTLHGIGGSLPTPFNTPSEYSEDHFAKSIESFDFSGFNILLSHSPAKGILDRTRYGMNIGSEEIAKKIEKFDLLVTGHVHECFGVHEGRVPAVNPGPVAWGLFAIIELEDMNICLRKI